MLHNTNHATLMPNLNHFTLKHLGMLTSTKTFSLTLTMDFVYLTNNHFKCLALTTTP